MQKERLLKLFTTYDSDIRRIVGEVIDLEREYLSMKNPRGIKQEIDEFVTEIAKKAIQASDDTAAPR